MIMRYLQSSAEEEVRLHSWPHKKKEFLPYHAQGPDVVEALRSDPAWIEGVWCQAQACNFEVSPQTKNKVNVIHNKMQSTVL